MDISGVSAVESSALLQLPSDVLQNMCQRLCSAKDLANLASCSKGCRVLVNNSNLWRTVTFNRFGNTGATQSLDNLSLPQIRRLYKRLSRMLVPATDIQGVPPGQYEVVWRTQKLGRYVGIASSEVNMSVKAHRVHPVETGWQGDDSHIVHALRHFENLPANQWVDISGGQVTLDDFCNIDARLWCHSGEWKGQLAWDYVQLVDMSAAAIPSVHLAASANAASGIATLAQDVWARVSRWAS